ncbi:MAG: MipA/OmpV family protein [Thiohalomonadales bacterium]
MLISRMRFGDLLSNIILLLMLSAYTNITVASVIKEPKTWGVAVGIRSANIPFKTETDRVNDIIPLIFYDADRFYIRGLGMGFRFFRKPKWEFIAIGRYRFFDIPAEYQNQIRGNAFDVGLQFRYMPKESLNFDFEGLSDQHGRNHAITAINYHWDRGDWDLFPYVRLRWKSAEFNNTYYGLNRDSIGGAVDAIVGAEVRYHIYNNLYAIGKVSITLLDKDTYQSEFVDTQYQNDLYLGIAFFNDKRKTTRRILKSKPYIRMAHGWATPSDIGELLALNVKDDPYNNQLTSLFYGHPVADKLFGIPFEIYMTPGVVYHHNSEVQRNFTEYVFAIKAYYTVKWPWKWRIGAAEGLSYTSNISFIEQQEMDKKNLDTSKLLNFLDFSVDVEIGDIFNYDPLRNLWIGWSLHHRSGIFSGSSTFGRISGGSNYNSVYLQYHW